MLEKDQDSSTQNPSDLYEPPVDIFAASGVLEEWPIRSWYDLPRKPQFVQDDDKGWEVL